MHSELFTCDNGVAMRYIDMGVQYSYEGHTLEIVGEYEQGELSRSNDTEVLGYYERGDDGVTQVKLRDGREFTLNSEEDYEALALRLLTE